MDGGWNDEIRSTVNDRIGKINGDVKGELKRIDGECNDEMRSAVND